MKQRLAPLSLILVALAALAALVLLSACATDTAVTTMPAKASVSFLDLTGFDKELNQSLSAKLPSIDVAFASNTQATAIPERMQQWLHAVEKGGGEVKVVPPQSSVTAKNPLLLLSLVSGIWNSVKLAKAVQNYEFHKPAQSYDAQIVLKISEQGDRLVDKILFIQRAPKP
ncbi:MAG: hypothetical protein RL761_53 [Pseudomonadota bacterium]|jgi:hypothetical protein